MLIHTLQTHSPVGYNPGPSTSNMAIEESELKKISIFFNLPQILASLSNYGICIHQQVDLSSHPILCLIGIKKM
ncbi:unnamed protein product [Acanthoscelides obtectus]|uniref:Uncharacterized protein n=1 Tax=Acanthoscelides obtectus TaxID=200917 RepID=A0A9P0PVF7_ACAOB|nr:unnamed protein product [Acanthoscelides obtectus]CAK1633354.1 hypothetical protein AOBTE_LOCUS8068 [Acanthoscelides obtectus]